MVAEQALQPSSLHPQQTLKSTLVVYMQKLIWYWLLRRTLQWWNQRSLFCLKIL